MSKDADVEMTSSIEIKTLGELRIQQEGRVLEGFISTKAILLLVYLAMSPGEHTRKKLASMFWSETNDHQALKNLRTVLSSVRQVIPEGVIVSRDALEINPDIRVEVDATLFERGCITAFGLSDLPDVFSELQNLVGLYQGLFLANVSFRDAEVLSEWITDKQRYLQQLYVKLLHETVEIAQKEGDYDIGLQYSRRLVQVDPYWESARRQLMQLLTYTNRANEALQQYEEFAQLLAEELDATPEEETTALYQKIRSREIAPPQQPVMPRSSIILPEIPFVEAVEDIALIQRMMNTPQCRLLTIHGISGIGKTVLATYVAFQRQNLYRHGAFFVSLSSAQSARDIPHVIAATLGIEYSTQTETLVMEEIILDYLKQRHLLLVLDNYEHLLPEIGFVQRLLEQASQIQMIVTSQAPLNLFREWLFPLQGMRVPTPDVSNPEDYEAVKLFELTVQRFNPRFNLIDNMTSVVEICQLVDGLPIAVIIAAGWTQIAPLHKIIEYLLQGQEFSLPVQQDLPPRHQGMEIMLDYTWSTLETAEQDALTALSVFNTSFELDEIEQICEVDFEVLTGIIRKSLVQKFGDKYRIHQLIWRYARKKLLYSDRKEQLGQRYMNFYVQSLRRLQEERLPLHEYLLSIEIRYPTLLNYEWMAKSFQPTYILTLSRFLIAYWEISRNDELSTIQTLFEGIAHSPLSNDTRMLLNLQLARLNLRQHQHQQAFPHISLAVFENLLDSPWSDWAILFNLWKPLLSENVPVSPQAVNEDYLILIDSYLRLLALYLDMRDYEEAENFIIYVLDSQSDPLDRALMMATRGAIRAEIGDFSSAFIHFSDALECLAQEPILKLAIHTLLMRVAYLQKNRATAYGHLREALQLAIDLEAEPAHVQLAYFSTVLSGSSDKTR
jgi:DNA-binding SARP family transcriptional activator/tetratricopeptide (TPR) repeat protein